MGETYLNHKNLIQGLTLSAIFTNLLTVIAFGFFLEGPLTARTAFLTMIIAVGLFLLSRSQNYRLAIHLFNVTAFIMMAMLMVITPQIDVTIIFLVPLFLANLFYKPRTILILSIVTFIATNVFALTYVASRNPFSTDDLIARHILGASLIVFMLLASYLRQSSEEKSQSSRQALKASEELFRQMVMNSPNFTAIYDVSTRTIQSWNLPTYLGYPIEEIIGSDKWDKLIHPSSAKLMPAIRKILYSTKDVDISYELKVYTKGIDVKWINYQISTLQKSPAGEVTLRLITLIDITPNKQIELQNLRNDLEKHKADILDTIVRGFSHEFRTPLATIETNLYMLQKLFDNDDSLQYIDRARKQIKRIVSLTEQLNTIIRLRNKTDLTLSRVSVNQLLQSCVKRNEFYFKERGLSLKTEFTPQDPYSLLDIKLMNIVLDNLLDNALKFTDKLGTITIKSEADAHSATITIADTGIGISEDMLNNIYNLFSREDSSHTRTGLGLGLSIARAICDSHHQQLSITSQENCCTTVRLTMKIISPKQFV